MNEPTTIQPAQIAAISERGEQLSRKITVDFSAIQRADLSPRTKVKYTRELAAMQNAGISPMDYAALTAYSDGLKSSRKSFLKSALRLLSLGHEQDIKSQATPANIAAVQASVYRLEAMRDAVKVEAHEGTKAHIWLSQAQVTEITSLCSEDLEGKRDWIVLGLLLGAGLRREELAELTFEALMQVPGERGKMRDVLKVKGKGDKSRVIPINKLLADRLREWKQITGGGCVARSLGMGKTLGESMSGVGIFQLVSKFGSKIGIEGLAPHDLRRTYAQLGYKAGVKIAQISTLLGHSSVTTTQKYLDLKIDFETTASDFIPLSGD